MHVTFRQLRLFLALVDQGSITAAARASHVTQPTVSMQLKDLADSVGLPLYEVVNKQFHLTEAGQALAQTARALVAEWAAFEQRIDAVKGLTRGQLRVAVVSTAKYFVPRLLSDFCAGHPEIDISLEVQNRDGVAARLRENRDDLYIMSMPPSDVAVERHAFVPNPLVVIAATSHRLAGKRRIDLRSLAKERFILRERGSGTRMACDAHFAAWKFAPDLRLELGSNEAIKQTVAGGMGLAVISRHALAADPGDEQLAVLDVMSFPVLSNWWILYPKGKRLSPLATVFLAHLQAAAATWQAPAGGSRSGRVKAPARKSRRA